MDRLNSACDELGARMAFSKQLRVCALSVLVLLSSSSCSVNILENFADKNSNEALYYDALELINDGDYTGALEKIALMTASYTANREVITLKASAYAGICGLNFLSFVEALKNIGSTRLFPFLLSAFTGGTAAKIDACLAAEDLVESIGTLSERSSDENMFLVLISFAKIGNVLSLYADSDSNGTVDAAYAPCNSGASRVAGDLYDPDVQQLGTGITLAIANIAAVTSGVDLGDASLTSISSACTTLAGVNAAYDFCSITDPASLTANHLKGIRSILKEDSVVGLGSDCTGDVSACFCP